MSTVLYVACTDDRTISIFDRAADGQLERRAAEVAVPGGPMWLATDPRHRYLYCPTLTRNEVLSFAIGADGSLSPLGSPVPYPDVGETDRTGAAWAGDPCPCIYSSAQEGSPFCRSSYGQCITRPIRRSRSRDHRPDRTILVHGVLHRWNGHGAWHCFGWLRRARCDPDDPDLPRLPLHPSRQVKPICVCPVRCSARYPSWRRPKQLGKWG